MNLLIGQISRSIIGFLFVPKQKEVIKSALKDNMESFLVLSYLGTWKSFIDLNERETKSSASKLTDEFAAKVIDCLFEINDDKLFDEFIHTAIFRPLETFMYNYAVKRDSLPNILLTKQFVEALFKRKSDCLYKHKDIGKIFDLLITIASNLSRFKISVELIQMALDLLLNLKSKNLEKEQQMNFLNCKYLVDIVFGKINSIDTTSDNYKLMNEIVLVMYDLADDLKAYDIMA
jgi:hypothetical protein